jgi:OOP family OmpA-OmpF porin
MIGMGKTDYDAGAISTFDDPMGFEFVAGFDTSDRVSVEFGMVQFGEADDSLPPEWHLKADGLVISGLFKTKVSEDAEVFVQLGLNMWDAEITEDGFGLLDEDDGTDLFYGIGLNLKMSEKFSLGARYNNYDFDGDDVTRFTVNAQFPFE